MTIGVTQINDAFMPDQWNSYFMDELAETNRLWSSGIIVNSPQIVEFANSANIVANTPKWEEFYEDPQTFTDVPTDKLDYHKISASKGLMVKTGAAHGLTTMSINSQLFGSDPMGALLSVAQGYWPRAWQRYLLAILDAIMTENATNNTATHGLLANGDMTYDIRAAAGDATSATESANHLNVKNFIQAKTAIWGDLNPSIAGIICHSAVAGNITVKDAGTATTTTKASESSPVVTSYLTHTVIQDDQMTATPVTNGMEYTTYVFIRGAFGFGLGNTPKPAVQAIEDLEAGNASGQDKLILRQLWAMVPQNWKWIGANNVFPSKAALGTAANWDREFDETKKCYVLRILSNG